MPSSEDLPKIASDTFAIIPERIFDAASGEVRGDSAVIVSGERLAEIVPAHDLPADLPRHEYPNSTLLPGLIDSHVHLAIDSDDYQEQFYKRSSAQNALNTLRHAQHLAQLGWTTLRIAGDADRWYAWIDVAKAIAAKEFWGPSLCGAGHYISPTGGGGDFNHGAADHCLQGEGLIADGVDEIRRAVRRECKAGSDWIKVLLSGAYMSQGDDPGRTLYSDQEFAALVDEATRWGRPVMVHAHGNDAIKKAIRAGARSIEHGTNLDQEAIDLLCEHDCYLVPTLAIGEYYLDELRESKAQAAMIEQTLATREQQHAWLKKAHRAGVKLVIGSDLGGYPKKRYAKSEFSQFVEFGASPRGALIAGTSQAATMLGRDNDLGQVRAGYLADLLICQGAPDETIEDLHEVIAVYRHGQRLPRLTQQNSNEVL